MILGGRMRLVSTSLAIGMALAMATVPAALARDLEWRERYEAGLEALEQEAWRDAVTALSQAIAAKGDSSTESLAGGRRSGEYLPYLHLGIAYYHLGLYELAIEKLDRELEFPAIHTSNEKLALLTSTRFLATTARERERRERRRAMATIVERAEALATRAKRAAELDAPIRLLMRTRAQYPDAETIGTTLRRLTARQEEMREAETRARMAANLREAGRVALDEDRLSAAAALFRQALDIDGSDASRRGLVQARRMLAERAAAAERARELDERLAEARRAFEARDWSGSLGAIELALALSPEDPRALELQARTLEAMREQAREQEIEARFESLVREAETALSEARPVDAAVAADRAITLGIEDERTVSLLERALVDIRRNRDELDPTATGAAAFLPLLVLDVPSLDLDELRWPSPESVPLIRVDDATHLLGGRVVTSTPSVDVTIEKIGAGRAPSEAQLVAQRTLRGAGSASLNDIVFREPVRTDSRGATFRVVLRTPAGVERVALVRLESPGFFARHAWLVAIVVTAVVGAGTIASVRQARRSRLRRRRANPYVAGSPVLDEKLFVGREALIDRVLQTVHNNSVLLYGERRIGKTTLQHQIRRRLIELRDRDYRFLPVFIDIQGTSERRFFATIAEEIFEQLADELQAAGIARRPRGFTGSEYGARELARDLRHALESLNANDERRVKIVLLIDEVDELNAYDPRVNQKLRSLFMRSFAESLVAIVSGVGIRKEWEHEGSPWYNFFEEIEVTPLTEESARRLVVDPVRGVFTYDGEAVTKILTVTHRRPYHVQRVCMNLVRRMHETKRSRITVADVEEVTKAMPMSVAR